MKLDPWIELDRAVDKIDAARTIRDTLPGLSAQQSYLAMYAATRARLAAANLEDRGSQKSTQSALLGLYRDDRTDDNPGKVLQRAYVYKQLDDYGITPSGGIRQVEGAEAAKAMGDAIDFIARMRTDVESEIGQRLEQGIATDTIDPHARLAARDTIVRGGGGIGE